MVLEDGNPNDGSVVSGVDKESVPIISDGVSIDESGSSVKNEDSNITKNNNNDISDEVKNDTPMQEQNTNSAVAETPNDISTTNNNSTTKSSGFFSRMGGGVVTPQLKLGDVYATAQKRAVQLREQAVTEVERLRQQQLERQKEEEKEKEVVIPPSTGMIVDNEISVLPTNEKETQDADQTPEGETVNQTDATVKEATTKSTFPVITSPLRQANALRDAFNIVRQTSADAAKELIFPIDAFAAGTSDKEEDEDDSRYLSPNSSNEYSSYSQEDNSSDSNASNPEEASVDEGGKGKDVINGSTTPGRPPTTATSNTLTPTRFTAATSSVFNATVGRYRKLKESASFDSYQLSGSGQPQEQQQEVLVGGADRVGGLRNFQLDGIIDNSAMSSKMLPPTMPFGSKPPGRDNLVMQTGGQWTMASNRGQNAVGGTTPLNNPHQLSRSPSLDATSTTAASETASVDGSVSSNRLPPTSPMPSHKPPSRTTSYYEEAVRAVLQPGERALFFGKGTMGVVLKPTYLASWRGKDGGGLISPNISSKRGGVFIDSLVPGGHADKSRVVFVGDQVIRIGAINVETMTLEEVVNVIAETKRPNIMVVSSEHVVEVVDTKPKDGSNTVESNVVSEKGFVSPLDLTFGFVNKLVAEGARDLGGEELGTDYELKQVRSGNSLLDNDEDGEEEVSFKSPEKGQCVNVSDDVTSSTDEADGKESENATSSAQPENNAESESTKPDVESEVCTDNNFVDNNVSVDIDTLSVYAAHRTNAYDTNDAEIRHRRTSLLKRSALFNPVIRSALHDSLLECVLDPRRFSFLEHFFKNFQSKKEMEAQARSGDQDTMLEDINDVTSSANQRRLLELYIELCKFHDVMMLCSESDRERLLDYARTISKRFLDDNSTNQNNDKTFLPEYVAHIALGGMEKVQAVKFALNDEDEFFEGDGDGFQNIRSSLAAFLSTQESFLSFLISDDCSRMRAYLRGSSPFLNVEPQMLLKPHSSEEDDASHHNFLLHAILHLVCMKENNDDGKQNEESNFIKNDALLLMNGKRNVGAASLLGCSFFIMRSLQKSIEAVCEGLIEDGMTGKSNNLPLYSALMQDVQFFWEVYIAPMGGSLSSLKLAQDSQEALDDVRRSIVSSVDGVLSSNELSTYDADMARALSSADISSSVHTLAEALLREYTLKIYPNFQRFIYYEWACKEAKEFRFDAKDGSTSSSEYLVKTAFKGMSRGFLNRLLRQMELPHGLSLHRRGPSMLKEEVDVASNTNDCLHNGDVALVFGSARDEATIQRFSCVSLQPETDGPRTKVLLPEDIPPVFESYADVPPFHERPFQSMLQDAKNNRMSVDGWEVSLTNFVIPSQASGESDDDKWMYCVSLVFRKSSTSVPQISEREVNDECVRELQREDSVNDETTTTGSDFQSPLSVKGTENNRTMKVSQELMQFNSKLQDERKWSQQAGQGATIGVALISSRNVASAMRETLSLLYDDFCSYSKGDQDVKTAPQHLCQPLVDILGVLSHSHEIEANSLSCLLQPYLTYTTSKYVDRPLSDQSDVFEKASGMQLLQALPPVPLALAFVTLILEQKVVFASSRRGMLMSASFAMAQLLRPLKWAHLHVPLVPVSMLDELIHYPAPFMLGIPTDEKESAAVLGALPSDVTLIDLDVGRVILASVFSNDAPKSTDGVSGEAVAGALRSQVLFLAESLGGAFGAAIHRNSWCSDSPLQSMASEQSTHCSGNFSEVIRICEEFITELISGIYSCCLWIEEKHNETSPARNESAIIFDEDRFYHIKNLRAAGRYLPLIQKFDGQSTNRSLSLSLDHFDLIFETFLRTQCLSSYISNGDKELMLFS